MDQLLFQQMLVLENSGPCCYLTQFQYKTHHQTVSDGASVISTVATLPVLTVWQSDCTLTLVAFLTFNFPNYMFLML